MATGKAVTLTPEQRGDYLNEAADLVATVLASLDRREEPCECCGLRKKENWAEHQAGETLEGIIQRLEKISHGPVCNPHTAPVRNYSGGTDGSTGTN